jgi:hypothetical protein
MEGEPRRGPEGCFNVEAFSGPNRGQTARPFPSTPKICKNFFRPVDTSRLLLAFLAFGAACTTLWAWMLATTASPSKR